MAAGSKTRCAIYTRKSSDERLDVEYSSLDNQRAYCSAYVASQGGQGWLELPRHYDDGGYSGGNLKRPSLKQLRTDIAAGLIDMVVVYKIDRLSRSLRDFANLIAEFERYGTNFVSVTQAMDTSTSMGRLTLNVLLSFAQFERELTSERLRHWFSGARHRGLWTSPRPFGYQVIEGRLCVDPSEAAIVRSAHHLYRKYGSARLVADALNGSGSVNRHGRPWSKRTVTEMLSNRLYTGYHPNPDSPDNPTHDAIVPPVRWSRTQQLIANSGRRRNAEKRPPRDAMLKGMLFGPTGHAMIHVVVRSRGNEYRYYLSTLIARYGPGASPQRRFRAAELEASVLAIIERILGTEDLRGQIEQRVANTSMTAKTARTDAELIGTVRRLVERVDLREDRMEVRLRAGGAVLSAPLKGQITETKRTAGWWRSPIVSSTILAMDRPDSEIGADFGISAQRVWQIRHLLRSESRASKN